MSGTMAAAFDAVAASYDEVFTSSPIGRAQRQAVWEEMERAFTPGQRILELNCGTGEDAIHLAARGVAVTACDASEAMLAIARRKSYALAEAVRPEFLLLRNEDLAALPGDGCFDGVLSNFSGLNCVADLGAVAVALASRIRSGGTALLCVFGRCCAWEIAWYLARGNPRKAFRRRRRSAEAQLDHAASVRVHYPRVRDIRCSFAPWFRLRRSKGVGVFVPPTFVDSLARRHPRFLAAAQRLDRTFSCLPVSRGVADHMLLQFERTQVTCAERRP